MRLDYSNTKIKKPASIDKIAERLINELDEELIYDLAVEIKNGIVNITGERITEWSGAFQLISEIAEGYLTNTQNQDKYFNLIGHVGGGLTYYQIEEIVEQAAQELDHAS